MKLKHIKSYLSSITKDFPDPKIQLEQYVTSVELTAPVVLFARDDGNLGPGKTVIDLGCGTGMLAIGWALVDWDTVLGIDCDSDALTIANQNAQDVIEDLLPNTTIIDFMLGKVVAPSNNNNNNIDNNSKKR